MIETAVQTAIYGTLNSALSIPVYDHAPQKPDAAMGFPYVTIGEDTTSEWDTDTEIGGDVVCTIHTWSRFRGREEVKQIQGQIYTALHRASLAFSGYAFMDCFFETSDSFLDADGLTYHGVQTFRVHLEEV